MFLKVPVNGETIAQSTTTSSGIVSGSSFDVISVPENQTSVDAITHSDQDTTYSSGDTYTYTLVSGTGGQDNNKFILSASGVITFAVAPDYESPVDAEGVQPTTLDLCSDSGSLTDSWSTSTVGCRHATPYVNG